ncbi:MAG: hypothetical protein DMG97_07730, partial [Acidobacteria bacterium]
MKSPTLTVVSVVGFCLFLCLPVAFAGSSSNGHHYGRTVSVKISPGACTVQVGQSQQFAAAISGTNNTAINWLVNGILGGNSTLGTISSSGMYGAPSAVPPSQVAVTAQSNAQSTASASATVSITPPPPISVSISPTSASLQVGQSSQFSATVSGTSNTGVAWLVNGILGGSFAVGTISSSGMY